MTRSAGPVLVCSSDAAQLAVTPRNIFYMWHGHARWNASCGCMMFKFVFVRRGVVHSTMPSRSNV